MRTTDVFYSLTTYYQGGKVGGVEVEVEVSRAESPLRSFIAE
jgi:hypothetical protein